jgi:hypothetical protein
VNRILAGAPALDHVGTGSGWSGVTRGDRSVLDGLVAEDDLAGVAGRRLATLVTRGAPLRAALSPGRLRRRGLLADDHGDPAQQRPGRRRVRPQG